MPRVILIGWDGADWRILDPLLESGALPNLRTLIGRGMRGVLKSTIPTHSWSAWPSFLTGVEPADHGVYDILESVPGTHKQLPVTYRSIKERTMLADLTAAGKRTLMVNVPLTFPPPEIEVTRARIEAMDWLIDQDGWDLAAFVFFSTDRVQRCLSNYVARDLPEYT